MLYGEGAEEEIHDEAGGKHPAHCGSQRDFRVEWQPTQNRRGAGIEGYVYNTSNRTAQRVSFRIERVDGSGSVVGSSTVWISGELPMTDRVYFSASVPTAARYRVQVLSFDWSCQGGGGGGM